MNYKRRESLVPPDLLQVLLRPISDAGVALARLDERVARSPVGSGWIERSHFADACASLWIDGELVHLEDLVLHDAGQDIRTPTHELTIARDVLRSRQGLTVEIHNTDAEGRLVLCDALAEAGAEQPEILLDFATLTGAARVALGTGVPALFCNDESMASELLAAAEREQDPCWRLPLHAPYREMLDSKIADIANASDSSYAGAITAALFLREFVPAGIPWAHFDSMAWNLKTQPGRPEGGEAMGLRAVFGWLEQRYGGG